MSGMVSLLPGYTQQHPALGGASSLPEQPAGCTVHVHQAQNGRNPWVVHILHSPELKGVMFDRQFCA